MARRGPPPPPTGGGGGGQKKFFLQKVGKFPKNKFLRKKNFLVEKNFWTLFFLGLKNPPPPPTLTGGGGERQVCNDLNECTLRLHHCHPFGNCTNTQGSFSCACASGFRGDAISVCEDINECASASHSCPSQQVCVNIFGQNYFLINFMSKVT